MKRKRHGPEQIIAKLREADAMLNAGASIGRVCRRLDVSERSFHRRRIRYGGRKAEAARQGKAMEIAIEKRRLKRAGAEGAGIV